MFTWWRHQMETFFALLSLCAGNSPMTGEFPSQRPVMWSFDVFFDLRFIKRLSKQSRVWWFETPSCSSWRHCNEIFVSTCYMCISVFKCTGPDINITDRGLVTLYEIKNRGYLAAPRHYRNRYFTYHQSRSVSFTWQWSHKNCEDKK